MKLLLLTYMPSFNATARHRVYEYLPFLERLGIQYTVGPPFSNEYYFRSLHPRSNLDRLHRTILILRNRIAQISAANRFNCVLIQRELMMYGPPLLEYVISRLNHNVIYDFDDALWGLGREDIKLSRRLLIDHDKVKKISNVSKGVIAATPYLAHHVRNHNPHTFVIPNAIDVRRILPKSHYTSDLFTIGWIGNPFNLFNLNMVLNPLRRLRDHIRFELKVVSTVAYMADGINIVNKQWSLADEASDLRSFDVGIMPLADDEVSRGKGSFKALMCMAAGVPVVCSPVGENVNVVRSGETGFLASTCKEWMEALALLAADKGLRQRMG